MMNIVQACGVVAKHKGSSLLVATMLSMFIFDRIEGRDGRARFVPLLDGKLGAMVGVVVAKLRDLLQGYKAEGAAPGRISSVPLMGGCAGLGLGLAMAHPARKVILMDGDASLLMELSGLATVATQKPANLLHIVVNNGTQFTAYANARTPTPDFRFADAARAAGYAHAERISEAGQWAQRLPQLLAVQGPVFVELMVQAFPQQTKPGFVQQEMPDVQFARMGAEVAALRRHLQSA